MVIKDGMPQGHHPILVVGAGIAGLQTARALLKRGFQVVILEQSEDVGGVWIRNYQGYGLQVPWELYQFPEFPYPRKAELSDYPSGEAVRDYVQAYARHFGLYRHILFSCRLISLRRKQRPPPSPSPSPPPSSAEAAAGVGPGARPGPAPPGDPAAAAVARVPATWPADALAEEEEEDAEEDEAADAESVEVEGGLLSSCGGFFDGLATHQHQPQQQQQQQKQEHPQSQPQPPSNTHRRNRLADKLLTSTTRLRQLLGLTTFSSAGGSGRFSTASRTASRSTRGVMFATGGAASGSAADPGVIGGGGRGGGGAAAGGGMAAERCGSTTQEIQRTFARAFVVPSNGAAGKNAGPEQDEMGAAAAASGVGDQNGAAPGAFGEGASAAVVTGESSVAGTAAADAAPRRRGSSSSSSSATGSSSASASACGVGEGKQAAAAAKQQEQARTQPQQTGQTGPAKAEVSREANSTKEEGSKGGSGPGRTAACSSRQKRVRQGQEQGQQRQQQQEQEQQEQERQKQGLLGGWGHWQAIYEDSCTGRQYTLDASYVVLCTGLYATPFIPTIPGQALYRGLQVHSRDFIDASVAGGKHVLVVGAGKTAVDVITELTATSAAASVTLLYRRPHWPLPRYGSSGPSIKELAYTRLLTTALLPHYYTAGPAGRAAAACLTPLRKAYWVQFMWRVNRALGVKKTLGRPDRPICQDIWYSGQVLDAAKWPAVINNPKVQPMQGEIDHFTPVSSVLRDGTELQPDIVLYATGYSNHYTFLEPPVRAVLSVQHDGLYLYRHCLVPGLEGLAFVGAEVSTFNNILTAALQAEWLAAVLAGDVALPPPAVMAADVAAQQTWRRAIMPPHKLRGGSVMLYMQAYHDQLVKDLGLPTRRKHPSWRHPLAECLEPYTARDYADVFDPTLVRPGAAAAAAQRREKKKRKYAVPLAAAAAAITRQEQEQQQKHVLQQQDRHRREQQQLEARQQQQQLRVVVQGQRRQQGEEPTGVARRSERAAEAAAAAAAEAAEAAAAPTAAERLGRAAQLEIEVGAEVEVEAEVRPGVGSRDGTARACALVEESGEAVVMGRNASGGGGGVASPCRHAAATAAGTAAAAAASSTNTGCGGRMTVANFNNTGSTCPGPCATTAAATICADARAGDGGSAAQDTRVIGPASAAAARFLHSVGAATRTEAAGGGGGGGGGGDVGSSSPLLSLRLSQVPAVGGFSSTGPQRQQPPQSPHVRQATGGALLPSSPGPAAGVMMRGAGVGGASGAVQCRGRATAATATTGYAIDGGGSRDPPRGDATRGGGRSGDAAGREWCAPKVQVSVSPPLVSPAALDAAMASTRAPGQTTTTPSGVMASTALAGDGGAESGAAAAASAAARETVQGSFTRRWRQQQQQQHPSAVLQGTQSVSCAQRASQNTAGGDSSAAAAAAGVGWSGAGGGGSGAGVRGPGACSGGDLLLSRHESYNELDEQDTLYSLDALPPALQAFRRTRVREAPSPGSPSAVAAASLAASASLAAVDPATTATGLYGHMHGNGDGAAAAAAAAAADNVPARDGGGALSPVAPSSATPSGRLALPSFRSSGPLLPASLHRALNAVIGPAKGRFSESGPRGSIGAGGNGAIQSPYSPLYNSPAAGRQSCIGLGAGGGGGSAALALNNAPERTSESQVRVSAAAAEAPAGPLAPAPSGPLRDVRILERDSSAGSTISCSSAGGVDGSHSGSRGGGGRGGRTSRRRFTLATLLMRNRTTNTEHEVSSSRMEPSSAAVSELAYKVLPPKHVEEAMAAAAAAAVKGKRSNAGSVPRVTPPPATPGPPHPAPKPAPLRGAVASRAAQLSVLPPPLLLQRSPLRTRLASPCAPTCAAAALPQPAPQPSHPGPPLQTLNVGGAPSGSQSGVPSTAETSLFSEEPTTLRQPSSRLPSTAAARAAAAAAAAFAGGGAAALRAPPSRLCSFDRPPGYFMTGDEPPIRSASSGISYVPSCSTVSIPNWPELMAAAAAAASAATASARAEAGVYSEHPFVHCSPPFQVATSPNVARFPAAAVAAAASGGGHGGSVHGYGSVHGRTAGYRVVHHGLSTGVSPVASREEASRGDVASRAEGCGGDRGGERSPLASTESGVSYMPTCSTLVAPPQHLVG